MGVKGRLKDMSLVDIIHVFHTERKTVVVHLGSEMGYGRVYIEGGDIVHAAYREFNGVDALYKLLAWQDGEFDVEPGAASPEHTIAGKVDSLLLEGLRRLDETRARGEESGGYRGDGMSLRLVDKLLELGILVKTESERHEPGS